MARRGHQETQRVPGMPRKAYDPVKCESGGKHHPTTREMKLEGKHVKPVVCTKCNKMP